MKWITVGGYHYCRGLYFLRKNLFIHLNINHNILTNFKQENQLDWRVADKVHAHTPDEHLHHVFTRFQIVHKLLVEPTVGRGAV